MSTVWYNRILTINIPPPPWSVDQEKNVKSLKLRPINIDLCMVNDVNI